MNKDCNCFTQRLKCMHCHREVDMKELWETWREPAQLELEISIPTDLDSRDIPAI